ncbi:MAG TPA: formimidoylglutamate deiminase [Pyrinomonadaceae bacterium]|nr:formimidoylglutamate deiminase [Pyrinomonadaceae bacterium]
MRTGTEHQTAWLPDFIFVGGLFHADLALVTDDRTGRVVSVTTASDCGAAHVVRLKNRALLPGMVNAHSHAFQRVIRGRTEFRTAERDSFWTWREQMYSAATRLSPEDLYDASRMAFLEMALSGITSVGEFHYLHHDPGGDLYDDPNLLSKQVVRAARDAGLRVALLRVAYARSGFETPANERQRRFITRDAQLFIKHSEDLRSDLARDQRSGGGRRDADSRDDETRSAWVGVAPHSVRAAPLDYLREVCDYARAQLMPAHMHVAEQPAEVEACRAEHGRTPVALLAGEGLLDARFTAVHAVHVSAGEAGALARAGAHVCACPTTERNLGDGIVPADLFFNAGARVALGTDSHAQIDLLEDARELEYHLRLAKLSRAVLAPDTQDERDDTGGAVEVGLNEAGGAVDADQNSERRRSRMSSLAARLFECATRHGASSIDAPSGELAPGLAADFFTVDLDDPSIAGAGAHDLLACVVFSLARAAVREVCVGGRLVVEDGRHPAQGEIVTRFTALQRRLWDTL